MEKLNILDHTQMEKKNGEWKKYNFEGEVILTIVYKNGQEFKIDGIKVKRKK